MVWKLFALLLAIATTATLSACGGETVDEDVAPTEDAVPTEEVAPAEGEEVDEEAEGEEGAEEEGE
ncbi:MAG: hypothetical protein AAF728_01365 [Cyanobacteria bacterium P01_D01_bin.128]